MTDAETDSTVAEALGIVEQEQEQGQEQAAQDADTPDNAGDGQDSSPQQPSDIDSLPEWAQAEIRRARREAAEARVKAREAQQAGMTDADRIRAEVTAEFAGKLAASELRAALADLKPEHVDDIVEAVNLSKFVTDAHEVDRPAVKAFAARVMGTRKARVDVGHGEGTGAAARQRSAAEQFADTISGMFTT